jgi:hypothetical protein
MRSAKEYMSQTNAAPTLSVAPAAVSGTVMFKRISAPTTEGDLANLDLNVVSDVSTIPSSRHCLLDLMRIT